MSKFIIGPHMRLQEWVAEEKGYFQEEGLDYEFVSATGNSKPSVKSATDLPKDQIRGMLFQRLELLLEHEIGVATLFGGPLYYAEQIGFRKSSTVRS